jgi:hypothetical protein
MTTMARIKPEVGDAERILVRLLRRYAVCRQVGEQPLPPLTSLGAELGIPAPAVVALASVFQLTEGCLGRTLVAECCCSPMLTADERALLLLLKRTTPAAPALGSSDIPHVLPGALVWAVASTRRLLDPSFPERMNGASQPLTTCPFTKMT